MDFEDACFHVAWAGFDETSIFPSRRPLLAHYTSISALESMLEREELWLSHPLLMNDHQELIWGMQEGRALFLASKRLAAACRTPARFERLVENFTSLIDSYGSGEAKDIYVTCFSEHDASDNDGLLSMWRGYGANGGGVAVVFNTSALTPSDDSPFVLAPVVYATNEGRTEMLSEIIDSLAILVDRENPSASDLLCVAANFFERLKLFSIFSKHSGFKEEREWRLAYLRDRDNLGKYDKFIGYHIFDGQICPKMKVGLSQVGDVGFGYTFEKLVDRILVGPRAAGLMSVYALERMIKLKGRSALLDRVRSCSTPFRG